MSLLGGARQVGDAIGKLGIVGRCEPVRIGAGYPRIHLALQRAATRDPVEGLFLPEGAGAGLTPEEAVTCALGEALERYAACSIDRELLISATADELGDSAVGFDAFAWFAAYQLEHEDYPFPRYGRDVPSHWVAGETFEGERRHVPASLVYLSWAEGAEDFFAIAMSTGTACHVSRDRARLSGLYEAVERDASMITWLRKLPRARIRFESCPILRRLHDERLRAPGVRYHVFDITTDVALPSALCLVEAPTARGALIAAGAATRATEREAVHKAMVEAAQGVFYGRSLLRANPAWRPAPGFGNVREYADHARLYAEPEMRAHADFLLQGREERDLDTRTAPDPEHRLDAAVEAVRGAGAEPIFVDLTNRDLADLGLACAKVLIPGAVPMVAFHGLLPAGSPRLRTVPLALGYTDASRSMNLIPHPFA